MSLHKDRYKLCAIFDTETTNLKDIKQAFAVAYIVNDLSKIDLSDYVAGETDDIRIYRFDYEFHAYIEDLISKGLDNGYIPIVCAYNLMFDLQTLIYELSKRYKVKALAQSSTHVYTLDLQDANAKTVLRFWDTYFLETRGLYAMGECAGVDKAYGDWNYELIRTPYTQLTDDEIYYASVDVQIIPAYLKWLVTVNPFIDFDDLGTRVLTKTSVTRQFGKNVIGELRKNGRKLINMYRAYAKNDESKTFESYALRRACFRGGYTFTAANYANTITSRVCSLDAVSMHHAFINHQMPSFFVKDEKNVIDLLLLKISHTNVDDVLCSYHNPFYCAFNALIELTNVRIKKGTVFERMGIGLLAESKFKKVRSGDSMESEIRAYDELVKNGFIDYARNAVFAFSKLMQADVIRVFVTEIEYWLICQIYDYDSCKSLFGEYTFNASNPCDYVTLQSNMLYTDKKLVKKALKCAKSGIPYNGENPVYMPQHFVDGLQDCTVDAENLESWYISTVKGMYNGIYGVQAMDTHKPYYCMVDGEIKIDENTICDACTYEKSKNPVIYTYGTRIVGYSRMHLCIAIILLDRELHESINILGGDTDSLKIQCDDNVTTEMLLDALAPLHNAIDASKKIVIDALKDTYSDCLAVDSMSDVGHFEIEHADKAFSRYHLELWNKARIDVGYDGTVNLTCAGVSRLKNYYSVDSAIEDLLKRYDIEYLPYIFGFNTIIDISLAHTLEHSRPKPIERICMPVTDYRGDTYNVDCYRAVCLYEAGRVIGDTATLTNAENRNWLVSHGISVCEDYRVLSYDGVTPKVTYSDGRLI